MNRDEALTELAMGLPEWPVSQTEWGVYKFRYDLCDRLVVPLDPAWDEVITESDWIHRRCELDAERYWSEGDDKKEGVRMNRDELLTKLAMELAEWPTHVVDCPNIGMRWAPLFDDEEDEHPVLFPQKGGAIQKGDWLQRRAELNVARELNPTSSSLTHNQAVEAARDTGICSDGSPCGSPHDVNDDAYCVGCPNEPMTQEEEEIPAQEKIDCERCGGCYYSPPHDECPCGSGRSDGSTASYYELPEGATELQDLISYRNLNSQDGEIFRAIYRKGRASHSDEMRDAKKVLFYAEAEVRRLERYGR